MADQLSLRGGTTAEHATFTGANKEVTVDTTKKTLVVNDGATVGGHPLMRENASNSALALGSASTPSLKFTGDTNTGIYSPGADQLAISTGGTGRLFINATGNVGVGTSAPISTAGYGGVTMNGADGSILSMMQGGSETFRVTNATGYSFINTTGSTPILLGTAATERLRITEAGLVGIGSSAPGASLDISPSAADTIYLSSPIVAGAVSRNIALATPGLGKDSSIDFSYIDRGSNFASTLTFRTTLDNSNRNVARMTITQGGLVGIGTTSPSYKLHVSGSTGIIRGESTGASFLSPSLDLYDSTHAVEVILTPASGLGALGTFSNHPLAFYTNNGEKARITSDGKLLVGTSTSATTALVQIRGNSAAATNPGTLYLFPNYAPASLGAGDVLGRLQAGANDGSVGATIDFVGDSVWGSGDYPTRLVFSTTADGASSPTERMRITSDAYVRLASGTGGIQFNGDTAAANALDDYEEGTWTPTATPNTSGTITLSSITASYTKIGNTVSIRAQATVSAVSSPLGYIDISLPFTNSGDSSGSVFFYNGDTGAVMSDFIGRVSGNVFRITFGTGQTGASSAPYARANTEITLSAVYRN
jgi:hypothetical protein